MALTREAVTWGFRLILGREPENEEGIQAHMSLRDESALVSVLLRSQEFRASGRFSDSIVPRAGTTDERTVPWRYDNRAALKLVVFGNCQAAGIARLAQAMTGDIVAQSFETTPSFLRRLKDGEFDLKSAIKDADLIWVQTVAEVTQAIIKLAPRMQARIRQLPPLNYAGFHPDCVYVAREGGGHLQGPMGEYQSSLAFWAWRNGVEQTAALDLFRSDVFEHLSFDRYHQAAQRNLLASSRHAGFAIVHLLDRWLESGCFMHTVNHPKLYAQADVVREALRLEGIDPIEDAAQWVDDGLARWPVWPVYPEIAVRSGLSGSYVFKLDRGFCPDNKPVLTMDLPQFIEASYEAFERAGGELRCERVESPSYLQLSRFVRSRRKPSMLGRIASAVNATLTAVRSPPASVEGASSPYADLPDHQFWRRAVERVAPSEIDPVTQAGIAIDKTMKVATAGSCFAQHIARTLAREQFNYLVVDWPSGQASQEAKAQGFGVFSARYGNLYTARQLLQLFDRAHGDFEPKDAAWQRPDGRWVDAFRPQVEVAGFDSAQSALAAARNHLADVRRMFASLDVFIFTLGLTETWRRRDDGAVYPLAPGVVAGNYDPQLYEFVNFDTDAVAADLRAFLRRLRTVNERAHAILTVSPVPLIATYEDQHVLVSTIHSKSVLRAAAAMVAKECANVDYFPSYEIITGPAGSGRYFEGDLRSVNEAGVAHVMRVFMNHYAGAGDVAHTKTMGHPHDTLESIEQEQRSLGDVVCDEEAIDRHRR